MNYAHTIKDIKDGKFKNVYLFYGKEHYLLDEIVDISKQQLNQSLIDFNMSIINGREVMYDELLSKISTLPFMDDKRIVLIKDFELLTGRRKNFSQQNEDDFIKLLSNIPDTTILIMLTYDGIDKRKKIVNAVKKSGEIIECDKLKGNDLFKWCKSKFKENNIEISDSNVMFFISMNDYENKNNTKTLADLESEILKIAAFVGNGNIADKDVIETLGVKKIEKDIFKLIDAMASKNASLALKIFNDMIFQGESSMMVLSMISRQIKIILECKKMRKIGYVQSDISKKTGVHTFVIAKALKQGELMDESDLIRYLNECLNIDQMIKSGKIKNDLGVELLLSKICLNIK